MATRNMTGPNNPMWKGGPPTAILPAGSPRPSECIVEECHKKVKSRGLCEPHYKHWHRNNGPLGTPKGPDHWCWKGGKTQGKDGYINVLLDSGKYIGEHRLVMEQTLGRPLQPSEEVHHKNLIRSDNRPENLELWSGSQPAGARVEDLVSWAKELLSLYEPEALEDINSLPFWAMSP